MAKTIMMKVRIDNGLKKPFFAVCKEINSTPSQEIQNFMLATIRKNSTPNALTTSTLTDSDAGNNVFKVADLDELFNDLEI